MRDVRAADRDRARGRLAKAEDALRELGLAVATDARDAEDLTGAHGEVDALQRRRATVALRLEPADLEDRTGRRHRRPRRHRLQLAADHQARDLGRRGLFRDELARVAAGAQHRDAIGDGEDLAELVGDEDHDLALVAERPHDREELVDLLRRQDGRRLVEDEQLAAAVKDLQDLDALLQPERQVLHLRVGIHRDAETLLELADACRELTLAEDRPGALVAEDDVLRDGERRDEHEVLVDHADPARDRVARRTDARVLALQRDRAGVGAVQAVEDVHERRLSGAVLTEERMDLVLVDDEVDAVQRGEVAEALHDAAHLDERGGGVCHGHSCPCQSRGFAPRPLKAGGIRSSRQSPLLAHACPSISYGCPSAAGGRERPTKPATARIVRM